jgi:hypothetical protein
MRGRNPKSNCHTDFLETWRTASLMASWSKSCSRNGLHMSWGPRRGYRARQRRLCGGLERCVLCCTCVDFIWCLFLLFLDDQASHCIGNIVAFPSLFFLSTTCHISLFLSLSSSLAPLSSRYLSISHTFTLWRRYISTVIEGGTRPPLIFVVFWFSLSPNLVLFISISVSLSLSCLVASYGCRVSFLVSFTFTVNAIVRLLRLCSNVWTRYISVSHQLWRSLRFSVQIIDRGFHFAGIDAHVKLEALKYRWG